MSGYGNIREMERKVRASKEYAGWVERNKAVACLGCGRRDGLECHHVPDLYALVLGLWKVYGNEEDTVAHAVAVHEADRCESVTLCTDCHAKKHPGRSSPSYGAPVSVANWTAAPRVVGAPFSQSTATLTRHSLGLVGFQLLLGVGWHVLNGHAESKMLSVDRRRLAELLGKAPGTSFNRSLDAAIRGLSGLGVLLAAHRRGNDVELHLSPKYLSDLASNPWFMPLDETRTSSTCVLALRWFLGTQSNRRSYKIGLAKLKGHLGMTVKDDWLAARALRKACARISWAKVEISKKMCRFVLSRKGATPVFSLRKTLRDSVENAR